MKRETGFSAADIGRIYEHIWQGGMPGTQNYDQEQLYAWYNSYVDTYTADGQGTAHCPSVFCGMYIVLVLWLPAPEGEPACFCRKNFGNIPEPVRMV